LRVAKIGAKVESYAKTQGKKLERDALKEQAPNNLHTFNGI
jgi:hypothetical protein